VSKPEDQGESQLSTVISLVDQAIADRPEQLAVTAPDGRLTYAGLAERAEAIALRLRELGIGPGHRVGLRLERSAALVAGALGIMRAGAAFVAIDPAYPEERVRWMLEDAEAAAVVTDAGVEVLPGSPAPGSTDVAYVVYTSGSTGRPKGVPVEHPALANLVDWHVSAFGLGAEDHCTQIASPGFDAVVWEIWPCLATGACIHVVPETLRGDPLGLRDWLVAEGITVSFLPTAVAEGMIGLDWPADTALRHVLTGGDALSGRPRPGLPFVLVNNYGLSETAVVATSGPVDPHGEGPPSIGRPIAGVVAEVVDEELIVGGVAVGPGYLNRPELTAERFFERDGIRFYRTGDRVRMRANGEIEFLGRVDDQLSIRGFRVEPGEVSAALNAHPGIEASVAVGSGEAAARRLVAYVVAGPEAPEEEDLDAFLAERLPEYMVPSRYVWIDALPVTAHGKIDRDALPGLSAAAAPAQEASGDVEARIVSLMAELLEVDPSEIARDQNFFLLGGHSMLGAQLIVRLERNFGVEISLRYLFDHPTAAGIAAEVERHMEAQATPV
jgi:acyl-CoA synthetase (AMP-forming)/AMP-acid ligase II/acyl carrier protein